MQIPPDLVTVITISGHSVFQGSQEGYQGGRGLPRRTKGQGHEREVKDKGLDK